MTTEHIDIPQDDNTKKADTSKQGMESKSVQIPKQIAQFRIEELLGEGGMGIVYRAYDETMRRTVALKVLHPSLGISKSTQMRFVREAWIAGQLDHHNIVKVYTRGEDKGTSYIAMEFVVGGSLADFIRKKSEETAPPGQEFKDTVAELYIRDTVAKFVGLGEALEHVHTKGFIHRDIKPLNILISVKDDAFKLTDFGIAHAEDMTKITRAGDFMGTVHYMSPELLTAHRSIVDKRTDIYSLGVTLYEALTLSLPFEADSSEKLITEILTGHRIPPRRRNKAIPHDLETILMKATNQDADRRYQTAHEFGEDLQRFLSKRPILARRERLYARALKFANRHTNVVLVSAFSITMLIASVYLYSKHIAQKSKTEQIIAVLNSFIENRGSLPNIAPLKSDIVGVLLNRLNTGTQDTLSTLFLKAMAVDEVKLPVYGSFDAVKATVNAVNAPVIGDSVSYQEFRHAVAIISTYELSFNGSSFKRFGEIAKSLAPVSPDTRLMVSLSAFFDPVMDGRYKIAVRRISKYYRNVALYKYKEQSVSRASDMNQDSLEEINSSSTEPLALTSGNRLPTVPMSIDSCVDSFSVWIIKKPPDDYPRAIHSNVLRTEIEGAVNITRVSISRDESEPWHTAVAIEGCIKKDISIPVAANLEVLDQQSRDVLLQGTFMLSKDRFDLSSLDNGAYSASDSLTYSPDSSCITNAYFGYALLFFGGSTLKEAKLNFDRLVRRGQFDANLVLIPDRRLAYSLGNTDEFFGDTLRFNIKFVVRRQINLDKRR
ncbi:MAG: serine/threonine-protein kinase [candidate division Zixibacteria bacterium]|nr:serine/threonine-protein kinase [candidate division Zixibacteria bacterium]